MTMTRLSGILASRSLESRSQIALRGLFTVKDDAFLFPSLRGRNDRGSLRHGYTLLDTYCQSNSYLKPPTS